MTVAQFRETLPSFVRAMFDSMPEALQKQIAAERQLVNPPAAERAVHNPEHVDPKYLLPGHRFLYADELEDEKAVALSRLWRGYSNPNNDLESNWYEVVNEGQGRGRCSKHDTYCVPIETVVPKVERAVHNPENVPLDKVPAGWRLVFEDEVGRSLPETIRIWESDNGTKDEFGPEKTNPGLFGAFLRGWTYVVPADHPAPTFPAAAASGQSEHHTTPTIMASAPQKSVAVVATPAKKTELTQATAKVEVKHFGTAIVLPAQPNNMPMDEAIEHLQRLKELGQREVGVNEPVHVYPFDGAVAFMKAMQQKFGWAQPVPTPGFFSSTPPQTLTIEIGHGATASIFWGRFEIPGISGYVECGWTRTDDGEPVFKIGGKVKQADLSVVSELAQLTRQIARDESIYRGQALRLRTTEDGTIDVNSAPGFIDLSTRGSLILPDLVEASVRANLFTPVERTEACRAAGIPIKRGVILAGAPGTGKTLTAFELAHKCKEHGWTFILIPKAKSLAEAMMFANRYAPAVVFAEDIDQVTGGDRDEAFNHLLNTVDGVNTKNSDVMLVFTTNHLGKIERTMVRPGRIDAIIEFPPPDHSTIEKFLRHYGGALIAPGVSLLKSADALEGAIPAICREAVERAKLYALSRGAEPTGIQLTDEDIYVAVQTMKSHTDFFQSKREKVVSPEEAMGIALKNLLVSSEAGAAIKKDLEAVKSATVG